MDRDKPRELYSWRETRRMIAKGELPWRFALPSFGASPLEGCFWFQLSVVDAGGERKFSSFSVCLWLPPSLFSLCVLFVPDSHASICWRVCMLHAIEGTQLHRCVAWPAVFSICLEQPPLQDHRPWWRAVEAPFGSFSFDMGLQSPDIFSSLPPPLSSWVLLWNKESCQEGESIIALAQGATFNVGAQMEKRAQHNKSAVM